MDLLQQTLFKVGDQGITFLSLIVFALVFIIVIVISRITRRILLKRVFPRHEISEGIARSISRIVNYLILVIGLLVALNSAGINVSLLFAGGAAVMVGIGFGLQNIANNFISGIIILFERPIKEGDFIEVAGRMGTVMSISWRSTRIKTPTGIVIVVPNSFFIEKEVVNRSYAERTEIDIPVTVSHSEDIERVKDILIRLGLENEYVIKDPAPTVSFPEINELGIIMKLWVTIEKQDKWGAVRSQINYRILQEFRKEGIRFPVQQREVTNINT